MAACVWEGGGEEADEEKSELDCRPFFAVAARWAAASGPLMGSALDLDSKLTQIAGKRHLAREAVAVAFNLSCVVPPAPTLTDLAGRAQPHSPALD
jgi:hypothetical protein